MSEIEPELAACKASKLLAILSLALDFTYGIFSCAAAVNVEFTWFIFCLVKKSFRT